MNKSLLQSKETLLPQKEEEYKIDKSAEEKAQELENDKKKEDIIDQQNFDNSVLITILSTTTADILGLFAIVIHYLFPNKK
mgnify:CR=1 FL=1